MITGDFKIQRGTTNKLHKSDSYESNSRSYEIIWGFVRNGPKMKSFFADNLLKN